MGYFTTLRGGPVEITGGGLKNFQWMNFFFSANCLHEFFFRRESSARFFFDSTPFIILWFSLLAGIFFEGCTACRNFFCVCNFPLQEFVLGIVTPPPVISNGPSLTEL